MIAVRQTIPAPPHGDCLRACIASLLEAPINVLPNPISEKWAEEWGEFLEGMGFSYIEIDLTDCGQCWWHLADDQYWIASVPSLNHEGYLHSVVMRGGALAHDPSLGQTYTEVPLDIIKEMTFLVPRSPR